MKDALNWLWLACGTAAVIVGIGFIAKAYWLLFLIGWGVL